MDLTTKQLEAATEHLLGRLMDGQFGLDSLSAWMAEHELGRHDAEAILEDTLKSCAQGISRALVGQVAEEF